MPSSQKVPKFDFESQFSMSKIIRIFLNFIRWRIPIQENIFLNFLLLKWCPIFDSSPLIQNSKFNNFLWLCWFLCKYLSNFIHLSWKLRNPYCHNTYPRVPNERVTFIFYFGKVFQPTCVLEQYLKVRKKPTWLLVFKQKLPPTLLFKLHAYSK